MLKDEVKKIKEAMPGYIITAQGGMPILRPDYCLGGRSNMETGRAG